MNTSPTLLAKEIKIYRKNNNLPIYDAGLGENPLPAPISLVQSIKDNCHHKKYTDTNGIPELRSLLGDKLIIGNGLKPLIFLLQLAFSKLYTNGIIFHIIPSWLSYLEQTNILNIKTVKILPNENYKITPNILDDYLKHYDCPKLVIFNNPCNPSGCIYTKEEIKKLSIILNKYDCIIFSDEIYNELVHNKYENEVGDIKNYCKKVIRGSSLSKNVACGGYRFGWLIFPNFYLDDLLKIARIFASNIYTCPSLMLQYAAITSLKKPNDIKLQIEFQREMFQNICEYCKNNLINLDLEVSDSKAAWYILIDFKHYEDKLFKKGIKNSDQLCIHLSTHLGLITVSGTAFGLSNKYVLRYSLVDISDINVKDKTFNYNNIVLGLLELKKWLNNL